MGEGEVYITPGVEGEDHGDPRLHLLAGMGAAHSLQLPFASGEVHVGQPCLVDIDYPLTRLQYFKHLLREELPEDQILRIIALEGNVLHTLVLQAHLFFKYSLNKVIF